MISFVVQKRRGGSPRNIDSLYGNLQRDLQEFLFGLREYPNIARLSQLDSYEETFIEGDWLVGLMLELPELARTLEDGQFPYPVPHEVGVTSDEDLREVFGVDGLRHWAKTLLSLCHMASERSVPLEAWGD